MPVYRVGECFAGTLERDLPQLGVHVPAEVLRRFWTMVAHYHGQISNGSEIGGSLGVTDFKLERLWVVYPGKESYRIHEKAECINLHDLAKIRAVIA